MNIIKFISNAYCTNTYLIVENGEGVVIDPADGIDRVIVFAEQNKITIKHVLVTHAHYDHIGGVAALCRNGASLYMCEKDYELVDFDNETSLFGAPSDVFTPDVFINDGDKFMLIGHQFDVIATPGHTPGGVCFCLDGKHLFSGDTLFMLSVGRTDFPFCSREQLSASLQKLFALDGDCTVYPGHGDNTTLDYERKNNPYA